MIPFARRTSGPLLAMTLAAAPSYASDAAAAQALFDDARKLMAAGRWEEACPKLEESQRLDPGVGTVFQLASCHEHVGRTASAWAEFLDAAQRARSTAQTARERVARQRAAALEPRLSHLTIAPARELPGLTIARDGREIGRAQWGTPVPVDPGAHTVRARAPGRAPWERTVDVGPATSSVELTVPPLVDARAAAPAVTPPQPSPLAPTPAPPPAAATRPPSGDAAYGENDNADRGRTGRTLGFVLLGAGAAGLGVGALFGLFSKAKHDDAQSHCDAANRCDAEGLALRDDAIQNGTISTVGFVTGLAATTAGVIVLVTAPAAGPARAGRLEAVPLFGARAAGLTLRTAW
jgi:hypothetical protein